MESVVVLWVWNKISEHVGNVVRSIQFHWTLIGLDFESPIVYLRDIVNNSRGEIKCQRSRVSVFWPFTS